MEYGIVELLYHKSETNIALYVTGIKRKSK